MFTLITDRPYNERAKPDVVVGGRTTETSSVSMALMIDEECMFQLRNRLLTVEVNELQVEVRLSDQ